MQSIINPQCSYSPHFQIVLASSPLLSSWHQCITGLSDREIQYITAGSMPTDRAAPQRPHTTASDPGPILLPRLVGQPWLLSTPSHSGPWADAHPTDAGTVAPGFSLPAFYTNHRGYNAVFWLRDGHVINLGSWVFLLRVKTRGEVRKAG